MTTFRTEEVPGRELVGATFGLQQWWTPEAFDAVVDTDRQWERVEAPPPEVHEHCILDWTTIEIGGDAEFGWRSLDDWICDECYRRYILEDHLGIRG